MQSVLDGQLRNIALPLRGKDQRLHAALDRRPVIKTGCISCLRAGRRCSAGDVGCSKHLLHGCDAWRVNDPLCVPQAPGGWRERRGVHIFLTDFAAAPERVGFFHSDFWHTAVPRACLQCSALTPLASAIGIFYEATVLSRSSASSIVLADATSLALRQCSKTIESLRSATTSRHGAEITLIACILFSYFESLQDDQQAAVNHSSQAPKLMAAFSRSIDAGNEEYFVNAKAMSRFVEGLQLQIMCLLDEDDIPEEWLPPLADIVLPPLEPFLNLQEANDTLHETATILMINGQYLRSIDSAEELKTLSHQRRTLFLPWLEQWRQRLDHLLHSQACDFGPWDLQNVKILQANHKVLTILASINLTGTVRYWTALDVMSQEAFDAMFKDIVPLASSVLSTHYTQSSTGSQGICFPLFAHGLSVVVPLFILMSRCSDVTLRTPAAKMLLALQRPKSQSNQQDSLPSEETDEVRRWLALTSEQSLEASSSMFFSENTLRCTESACN